VAYALLRNGSVHLHVLFAVFLVGIGKNFTVIKVVTDLEQILVSNQKPREKSSPSSKIAETKTAR
jgi:hypothetical protein